MCGLLDKKNPQLHRLKNHHCQIAVGIMKEIIWIEEAYPSAVEGLLVDNHKALNVVKRTFTSILEMIV